MESDRTASSGSHVPGRCTWTEGESVTAAMTPPKNHPLCETMKSVVSSSRIVWDMRDVMSVDVSQSASQDVRGKCVNKGSLWLTVSDGKYQPNEGQHMLCFISHFVKKLQD